jgi:hypothetical protein
LQQWTELDQTDAEAAELPGMLCEAATRYRDGRAPPSFEALLRCVWGPLVRKRRSLRRPRDAPSPAADVLADLLPELLRRAERGQ